MYSTEQYSSLIFFTKQIRNQTTQLTFYTIESLPDFQQEVGPNKIYPRYH